MNRLFLFLSVLSFCLVHHNVAHSQTIIIRQGDFAGTGTFPGTVASGGAPMRIVPATIGRPDPSVTSAHQTLPAGLLVPRSVEATPASAFVVSSDTTVAAQSN